MAPPFSTVSVVGLGTTGSALAVLFARSGRRVVGVEADESTLAEARERVRRCAEQVTETAAAVDALLDRVEFTTRLPEIKAADLVIEALPERLDLKCDVLAAAHQLCAGDAVFVTTTSSLSVTEIASRSGRMTRTVGLHLFTRGALTPDGALELVSTPVTEATV